MIFYATKFVSPLQGIQEKHNKMLKETTYHNLYVHMLHNQIFWALDNPPRDQSTFVLESETQ